MIFCVVFSSTTESSCIILIPTPFFTFPSFLPFCEVFLGIKPHFDLSCYLFHLKPQPTKKVLHEVRGAGLQLRQGTQEKYISYKFPTSLFGWREKLFYIENHEPSRLERTAGHSRSQRSGLSPAKMRARSQSCSKSLRSRRM
jgi:hypothetical protein